MQSDIAFLAYYPLKKRQDNNSFEGNYNIGANVIIDVLRHNGMECEFCTPDTANKFKIVLVSLTSDYDCIALYKAVALLPSWQPGKRKFQVVGGGAGMQNPTTVRNYIDYAVFGRAENIIYPLIDCLLGGRVYTHESVMKLPEINPVILSQVQGLYPHEVDLGGGRGKRQWKESFIGCPNKCLFCHYTWARSKVGSGTYYQGDLTLNRSIECLWKDIPKIEKKEGRIRTAIDGFSERLRFAFGKRITNQEIVDGINHIGSFAGITVLLTYNISNMPFETQADREELYETVKRATPKNRVIVVFQSTPFRPSLLTPLQWAPVALYPATSDLSASVIYDSDNLRVIHSFSNESPFSQLETVIVSRATPETDKLFHALCFHPKLKTGTSRERVGLLERSFDMTPYLKEYQAGDKHPAWFLRSYTTEATLLKAYGAAKRRL
jgi:hypothetical protein